MTPTINPTDPYRRPTVGLSYPLTWEEEIAQEIRHRVLNGLGGARLVYVVRDAALSAPLCLPWVRVPRASVDGPLRYFGFAYGPTLIRKLAEVDALDGTKKSAYVRCALRYYLDLPRDARRRNLPGSDPASDPMKPGAAPQPVD